MVYHEDLADLSPAQLQYEAWWGGQLAARDPERFVWRGLEYVTVREWADERVRIIHNLLQPAPQPESTPAETKVRMGSWSTP